MLKNITEWRTALLDAAAAHHEYEQTLGHADELWPIWYAKYILRSEGKVPSFYWRNMVAFLADLLWKASQKFTGEDWADRYAEFLYAQM